MERLKKILFYPVWRFLPPCREVVRTASDSMDRELSLLKRAAVRIHLYTCRACLRYREQIGFLRLTAGRYRSSENAPGLSEEARARLKKALRSSAPGS